MKLVSNNYQLARHSSTISKLGQHAKKQRLVPYRECLEFFLQMFSDWVNMKKVVVSAQVGGKIYAKPLWMLAGRVARPSSELQQCQREESKAANPCEKCMAASTWTPTRPRLNAFRCASWGLVMGNIPTTKVQRAEQILLGCGLVGVQVEAAIHFAHGFAIDEKLLCTLIGWGGDWDVTALPLQFVQSTSALY